jgi:hypothetical protein
MSLLFLKLQEFSPARVNSLIVNVIWVLCKLQSTIRAQAKAIFAAYGLEWKAENNRVSDDRFQVDLLVRNREVIFFCSRIGEKFLKIYLDRRFKFI